MIQEASRYTKTVQWNVVYQTHPKKKYTEPSNTPYFFTEELLFVLSIWIRCTELKTVTFWLAKGVSSLGVAIQVTGNPILFWRIYFCNRGKRIPPGVSWQRNWVCNHGSEYSRILFILFYFFSFIPGECPLQENSKLRTAASAQSALLTTATSCTLWW